MTADRAVQEALAAAYDRARAGVARRIAVLDTATNALVAGSLDEAGRADSEREAHKLAGSAGTFGLPRISELARSLEEMFAVDQLAADFGTEEAVAVQVAAAQRDEQRRRSARELVMTMYQVFAEESAATAGIATDRGDARPAVLVAQEDVAGAARLAAAARTRGIRPVVVTDLSAVVMMLSRHRVLAAVIAFPPGSMDAETLALVEELSATGAAGTLLVRAPDSATASRLAILGAGADVILDPEAGPDEIGDSVVRVLDRPTVDTYRVLAVDDDPDILAAIRKFLEPEQIRLYPVDDPTCFWEELAGSDPDLVILDMDIPGDGGIDLCRLVRADARWRNLPILCLGASGDRETVREAFEAGADDYVIKPVFGPELVSRVRHRIERFRLQRLIADADPLTGLANRRRLEEQVGRFISISRRLGQPMSVAVLNVDGLDEINQDYGLAVGDAVLRQFGAHLGRAFRNDRVLARVSGAQFILARLGATADDTAARLADALQRFGEIGVELGAGIFLRPETRGTIVVFPDDGEDLHALYRRAAHGGLRIPAEDCATAGTS